MECCALLLLVLAREPALGHVVDQLGHNIVELKRTRTLTVSLKAQRRLDVVSHVAQALGRGGRVGQFGSGHGHLGQRRLLEFAPQIDELDADGGDGVADVVQRGTEAVFTDEGMKEIQQNLDYYRANAAVIAAALDEAGVWYCGGKNSPYIWLRCPNEMGSWEFFDWLLETANVVGTPGEGFGECGKGYFRLTAFGDAAKTKEAAARIVAALKTL